MDLFVTVCVTFALLSPFGTAWGATPTPEPAPLVFPRASPSVIQVILRTSSVAQYEHLDHNSLLAALTPDTSCDFPHSLYLIQTRLTKLPQHPGEGAEVLVELQVFAPTVMIAKSCTGAVMEGLQRKAPWGGAEDPQVVSVRYAVSGMAEPR
eukprot:RCo041082